MAQSVIGSLRVNLNISHQAGTANPLRNKAFQIYPPRNNITQFFQTGLF